MPAHDPYGGPIGTGMMTPLADAREGRRRGAFVLLVAMILAAVAFVAIKLIASDSHEAVARAEEDVLTEPGGRGSPALPPLPHQGVAVDTGRGVALYSLDGRALATLRGFHLYDSTARPGPVVLTRGGRYFELESAQGRLRGLASRRAADRLLPADGSVDLRPIDDAGRWRYALGSPDDAWRLAQWSGECEIPTAFFVATGGGRPLPVVGTSLRNAPNSLAMGWTADGRAIVLLPEAACGSGFETAGVYLFDSPNDGTLVAPVGGYGGARAWGGS